MLAFSALSHIEIKTDPDSLTEFSKDWSKPIQHSALAVAFPKTTQEVSDLVKYSVKNKIPIVPSGGRTGLSGGAVSQANELVISLKKMNRILDINTLGLTATVEAGVITEQLHIALKDKNLTWPVDFASKGSSHIGGNIATNAGGINVIKYGSTRNWVLGLTAVTGTGEILKFNGALEKNNSGFDFRHLFIASEGCLGIITEAILKLTPLPGATHTLFFALDDMASVMALFRHARLKIQLHAFEYLSHECLELVCKTKGISKPFAQDGKFYVVIEAENTEEELGEWLESTASLSGIINSAYAANTTQKKIFWSYRESVSESISIAGAPLKFDVSLPIQRLEAFVADLKEWKKKNTLDVKVYDFGHIGDGNIHLNLLPSSPQDKTKLYPIAEKQVAELIGRHEGSLSAEHGIGTLKKNWLLHSKNPVELELFRQIKKTFDPHGILNPGKIF